jgi:hypothetical protein
MPGKSFSLSNEVILFLSEIPEKNLSKLIEKLILDYKRQLPAIKKQEALKQLRAGALTLQELGYPREAILSWARAACEDEE